MVAAADSKRKEIAGRWFVTSNYRIYSMLRWHLRDAVPVMQINERVRYIGFGNPVLDGPVGLYVALKENARADVWHGPTSASQDREALIGIRVARAAATPLAARQQSQKSKGEV